MTVPEDDLSEAVRAFVAVADELRMIVETISGYRAQLVVGGFSEEAAEVMAAQMHAVLLSKMLGIGE